MMISKFIFGGHFIRFSHIAMVSTAFALSACGAGETTNPSPTVSSSDNTSVSEENPVIHNFPSNSDLLKTTIQGAASKGVISNAKVVLYNIQEGNVGTALSETTTDDSGHFRFQISSGQSTDFLIETFGGNGAIMKCDFHLGCGDSSNQDFEFDSNLNGTVDFGEWFTLPDDFVMSAVVTKSDIQANIQLSPLSHLAVSYANSLAGGLTTENIQIANSQTAQVFNLSGNVVNTAAIDLTDATQVEQADNNQLELATLSAAFLAFSNATTLSTTLNQLADSFASQNGQMLTHDQTNSITLANLREAAGELAATLELDSVYTAHQYSLLNISNLPSGSYTVAAASDSATLSDLEKAKTMVNDLQMWQSLLKLEGPAASLKEQTQAVHEQLAPELIKMQAVLALSSQWAMLPALPELAIESSCNSLNNDLLTDVCLSVVDLDYLHSQCEGGSGLTVFGTDICDLLEEVRLIDNGEYQVTYRFFDGTVTVTGSFLNQSVDLLMSAEMLPDNRLQFSTTGTISNDSADLNLTASAVTLQFANELNIMHMQLPESASLLLEGELIQYGGEGASFSGTLAADLDLTVLAEQISASVTGTESTAILLSSSDLPFDLSLSGTLGYGNGEYTEMTLTGNGTQEGGHFSAGLSVLSTIMDTEATATLQGTFNEIEMRANQLEMNYSGHSLNLEKDSNGYLVATSLDGAILTINPALTSGIVGYIEVNGEKIAEMELVNHILYANFTDDSASSLFFGF